MKIRYENNSILIDTNYRGWNPEILIEEISEEYYEEFVSECNQTFSSIEDMELKDAIEIIILLAQNGKTN